MKSKSTLLLLLAISLLAVGVGVFSGNELLNQEGNNCESLHVKSSDDTGDQRESAIKYEDLSTDQQQLFRKAVEKETGPVSIPDDVNSEVWITNRNVQYNGTMYSVAVSVC
ncbi:hypothetical protein [Haloarchaeobius sp. DT45]|uniref:hypothetical protein n=1 Tax=Haloarchaeobius sp. DT45 TaxID=3446116 RepID=UPI003F6C0A8F